MAGDIFALLKAFDEGRTNANGAVALLSFPDSTFMLTDSKQIFDLVTKKATTVEKKLTIDLPAARESYKQLEIDSIWLVRGKQNRADGLSKMKDNEALTKVLRYASNDKFVEQELTRNMVNSDHLYENWGLSVGDLVIF